MCLFYFSLSQMICCIYNTNITFVIFFINILLFIVFQSYYYSTNYIINKIILLNKTYFIIKIKIINIFLITMYKNRHLDHLHWQGLNYLRPGTYLVPQWGESFSGSYKTRGLT